MRPLTVGEVSITVEPGDEEERPDLWTDLPEDAQNYCILALYKEQQLNPWKWCCVCVEASWQGLYYAVYLGMCSYESEQEFLLCDYYADMVDEAMAGLTELVEAMQRPSCECETKAPKEV
jgi:hypothetical protein